MDMKLANLITSSESEFLEFKRDWYWGSEEGRNEKAWGEFLKDFIALVNCNEKFTSQDKYLIIGVDESENDLSQRVHDIDLPSLGFDSVDELRDKIIEKVDFYFRCGVRVEDVYTNFDLVLEEVGDKRILFFTIKPADRIIVLAKDIQDKNRTEKMNNVFLRSLKKSGDPEVINASPEDISSLRSELERYHDNLKKESNLGKNIEKTIKLFLDSNAMFSLGNVSREKNWKKGILCEVYCVISDFKNINFIYLYKKASQTRTYEYLLDNEILSKDDQNIVLIDNGLKKDISGIKEKFKATDVFSLDDFALTYLYKKHLDEDIYHDGSFRKQRQVKNFIDPFSEGNSDKNALTKLLEWYEKESMPLMVIKGYGGVGKTTLVKYFLDDLHATYVKEKSKSKILFIDSKKIIDEISREGNIDNIFFFYQAYAKNKKLSHRFDRELLELSLDNGNLLLVLDGIDEVIAKLGSKFKVNLFIENIYKNYLLGNGRTKIIFTCRDFFWDISSVERSISTLEITPFSEVLAKKFFLKQFDENSKDYALCLKYSDEFKVSEETSSGEIRNVYIPYILDVVMDMVRQKKELGEVSKEDVSSEILNTDISNDYFIGRICNREIEKLKNLGIDQQLEFFINMAVRFDGSVQDRNRAKLFKNVGVVESQEVFDLFKGHTLISFDNRSGLVSFKYDFFKDYFLNLYVSKYFINKVRFDGDSDFVDIFNEHIGYGNSFTTYLCRRIPYDVEFKLFVVDIVESVVKKLRVNENDIDRKLISSLLIVLLVSLKDSNQKDDTETRTELLIDLFGANLDYLSIVNFLDTNDVSTIFDFRGRKISNAWIENYSRFWECKIDENTCFYKSTFAHLEPREGISLNAIHKNLFVDCDVAGIHEILDRNDKNTNAKKEVVRNEILRIFKLFESNGTYKEQKVDHIRHKSKSDVLEVLLKNKVIQPYKNPKKPTMKQFRVSEKYFDIISLSDQSGTNTELQKILKFFTKV